MMCHHFGDPLTWRRIRRSVASVTRDRKEVLTPDLGGNGTTESFTQAIIEALPLQI